MHEECGIFGIWAPGGDVARMTCFGLQALQHRGQESAGIAVGDGKEVILKKERGLVTQAFDERELGMLRGSHAVGHVRYSTSGEVSSWFAAQPHLSHLTTRAMALAHNGTLNNTDGIREELLREGVQFRTTTDSEVAAHLIDILCHAHGGNMTEGIREAMGRLKGAYAMIVIDEDELWAFRDPNGIRPLCLGTLPDGKGWVLASETCALDIVGASYEREVAPGEIIHINADGLTSVQGIPAGVRASCIFEYVYFARPDSIIDAANVFRAREAMGRRLAIEAPVDADIVIGVPDSGVPGAIGYARESGIMYTEGIVKNRYVGRTFIQPTQELRKLGIKLKLNPLPYAIRNRRVVVIDDSIVRGNTSKQLVTMLREAGASEVHMRIVSPPIAWPCYYGVDTGRAEQLIAAQMDVEGIREFIDADSLAFLSPEGLSQAIHAEHPGFCTACFTGKYPVEA